MDDLSGPDGAREERSYDKADVERFLAEVRPVPTARTMSTHRSPPRPCRFTAGSAGPRTVRRGWGPTGRAAERDGEVAVGAGRGAGLRVLACGPAMTAGTSPRPGSWSWRVWHEGAVSVVVVSDAEEWVAPLIHKLEVEGYAVRVDEGGDALHEPGCPFDVGIVDLAMVRRAPSSVCRALRARSPMPILGVSSRSVPERTVLAVYASGADQVAPTADRPSELAARVRALLRRHPPRSRATGAGGPGSPVQVDLAASTATVAGRVVPLTRWECEVLHRLARSPGRVVRRAELGGSPGRGGGDQSLDAVVRRVRTKLEAVEGRRRIVAVRGVGFRFLADGLGEDVPVDRDAS